MRIPRSINTLSNFVSVQHEALVASELSEDVPLSDMSIFQFQIWTSCKTKTTLTTSRPLSPQTKKTSFPRTSVVKSSAGNPRDTRAKNHQNIHFPHHFLPPPKTKQKHRSFNCYFRLFLEQNRRGIFASVSICFLSSMNAGIKEKHISHELEELSVRFRRKRTILVGN